MVKQCPLVFILKMQVATLKMTTLLWQGDYQTKKLKTVKMRAVNWGIEFEPTVASISRFKFMTPANSEETTFIAKTEDGDLGFTLVTQHTCRKLCVLTDKLVV